MALLPLTIANNWSNWIPELSKTRTIIAVEMQGQGRTADVDRDFSYESLADAPDTTHVTFMEKADAIIPMVKDFLDADSRKK